MVPTLKPADSVLAIRFLHGRPGDIVIAKHKSLLIIKRVASVKNGRYFLLGDNPRQSLDSRHFGAIPKEDIVGLVFSRGTEFNRK
jgi:signal peptidase I